QGIPYEWGNLTSAQQTALNAGDTSGSPSLSSLSCPTSPSPTPYAANDRLAFLRGDRSCEVSTAGVGLFRRRSDVLGDIVDSSPAWVGPPIAPYTAVWSDRLYPSATNPETASGSQTYTQFVTAAQTRTNVVYAGSNDGLLHGFRSGSYDANVALDVTDPTPANFAESKAASLVVGEWNSSTISCASAAGGSSCGSNLGNTYGTPQLRRLHDGKWAIIFGNGYGSATGDAGIFIMTIDPNTAATTFYYLSTQTGSAASPNGIAFPSAADLDADHTT